MCTNKETERAGQEVQSARGIMPLEIKHIVLYEKVLLLQDVTVRLERFVKRVSSGDNITKKPEDTPKPVTPSLADVLEIVLGQIDETAKRLGASIERLEQLLF